MNILKQTYYYSDYKHGGHVKIWGKILDIKGSTVSIYIHSNPTGSKIFNVSMKELSDWIKSKLIFKKERRSCHTR